MREGRGACRARRLSCLAGAVLAATIAPAAEPVPAGPEFQVNSYTTGLQDSPAVVQGIDGGFVVLWESSQDGSIDGIFGQRFGAGGTPAGGEFQVNSYTIGAQRGAVAAGAPDGRFVALWNGELNQDGSQRGVYGQRFDADGQPLGGEFRVNTYTGGNQDQPAVCMDEQGDFVVAWETNHVGAFVEIFAARFDSGGAKLGSDFQVNTVTLRGESYPAVACDADGDFVVAWRRHEPSTNVSEGLYAQRYNSAGTRLGGEFKLNSRPDAGHEGVTGCRAADGRTVLAWRAQGDGDGTGVFARRYDAGGGAQGTEFLINTYTVGAQGGSVLGGLAVICGADASFAVAWPSFGQDGDRQGIFARRFASSGSPAGSEFQVNTFTVFDQGRYGAALAGDPDGDFVVAWDSSPVVGGNADGDRNGVFGQRFALPTATPTDSPTASPTATPSASATATATDTPEPSATPTATASASATGTATTAPTDSATPLPDTPTPTPTPATACAAAPRDDCRAAGAHQLRLKRASSDTLRWKWTRGAALAAPELGLPTSSASYALCLYDARGLRASLVAPAGAVCGGPPCWKPSGSAGFRYRDQARAFDGLDTIVLKSGAAGRSKAIVTGRGDALPDPGLPLSPPVVVQLVNDQTPLCLGGTYAGGEIRRNDAERFSARR